MTTPLYLQDAYQTRAAGTVTGLTEQGGIILDQSLFYATSGGQPGDCGTLIWDDQDIEITTTLKGEEGTIILIPAEGATRPKSNPSCTHNSPIAPPSPIARAAISHPSLGIVSFWIFPTSCQNNKFLWSIAKLSHSSKSI